MNIFQSLRSFKNKFDFGLRQAIRWRRNGFYIPNEVKDDLFSDLLEEEKRKAEDLAHRLLTEYHLEPLFARSTRRKYRENLYYLELLETALNPLELTLPQEICAADIGVSDWFYVRAYQAALRWWRFPGGRRVFLEGYETDPYRMYADFHTRYDYAMAFIQELKGTSYHPGAFETHAGQYHLVSLLFPFIFIHDHLNWGLPGSSFQPMDLLEKAWNSLREGGIFLIVNQGKDEHERQKEMLANLQIKWQGAFRFDSVLFKYEIPRYGITALKNG
jgi:hypothetical protein